MINFGKKEDALKLIPGFYNDLSDKEYFSLKAISNSEITNRIRYPHGCLPTENYSNAMRFGRAFHAQLLQFPRFNEFFDVLDMSSKNSSVYKKWIEENSNAEKDYVTKSELEEIELMCGVVAQNQLAMDLLKDCHKETVCIFKLLGHVCKMKMDAFKIEEKKIKLIDIKSTRDIENIEKYCISYGYVRQLAFYSLGLGGFIKEDEYSIESYNIFVEKPGNKSHIGIKVTQFSGDDICFSMKEIADILKHWKEEPAPIQLILGETNESNN